MIVIKDVPGLTPREVLEALTDITGPDDLQVVTGHGGFVVDEDMAERFLSAYLIAAGKRSAPTAAEEPSTTVDSGMKNGLDTSWWEASADEWSSEPALKENPPAVEDPPPGLVTVEDDLPAATTVEPDVSPEPMPARTTPRRTGRRKKVA